MKNLPLPSTRSMTLSFSARVSSSPGSRARSSLSLTSPCHSSRLTRRHSSNAHKVPRTRSSGIKDKVAVAEDEDVVDTGLVVVLVEVDNGDLEASNSVVVLWEVRSKLKEWKLFSFSFVFFFPFMYHPHPFLFSFFSFQEK